MTGTKGGEDDKPVTPEEYKLVRDGNCTDEQIKRVKAALRDPTSPLSEWLGEDRMGALMYVSIKRHTGEEFEALTDALTPVAQKNCYRVIEYLRHKRETGVLTPDEVNAVLKSMRVKHLDDPRPTPAHWAMCVSRMTKALLALHPELESEVRALPISRKR
jgi:hypothetical protein